VLDLQIILTITGTYSLPTNIQISNSLYTNSIDNVYYQYQPTYKYTNLYINNKQYNMNISTSIQNVTQIPVEITISANGS